MSREGSGGPRVAVVGSGYVGTVAAACLATVGRQVVGLESDPIKLAMLQRGIPPFFEPGLQELLGGAVARGLLRFTDDVDEAMQASDVVFLCVGTPQGSDGHPDMTAFTSAASAVGAAMHHRHVLVTKSTVPIGTGQWLESLIENALPPHLAGTDCFAVVSCPEFLREGNAVEDFLRPHRIVLGSGDQRAIHQVAEVYRPILDQSFPGGDPFRRPWLVSTSLATAETVKYAANAFLATKISFINEIANICELVGADVPQVATAIGLDPRIGGQFLNAGAGWGGSCFGKDLSALTSIAAEYGYDAQLLRAAVEVNSRQRRIVVDKLRRHLKTLRGRRVALLGLAFKAGTDDLRDAPAIDIAARLLAGGVTVSAHDPMVSSVPDLEDLRFAPDPYAAADGADAVVLLTDWPEYKKLDLGALLGVMRGDLLVDARNMMDPPTATDAGFVYEGMGRGTPGAEHRSGEPIAEVRVLRLEDPPSGAPEGVTDEAVSGSAV